MKKYIKYVLFLIFCILIVGTNNVNANTSSTIFIGQPIVLDNYTDIEITQNNVEINEETSEIKNTQLYTNLSNKTLTKKATIKLEDSYSNLTVNSLEIYVNDLKIKNITKDGDNYFFYFQIPPKEGKKIIVTYKTNSSLQNAKIIKYSMDVLKGKNIKLFQISVKLSKYDIPLVQKIWPGAYGFEDNIVSTEYVDFTVNNLTSNFIIQKETYNNFKYGEYSEGLSDFDEYILKNAKKFVDGDIPKIKNKNDSIRDIITYWVKERDYEYGKDSINDVLLNLVEYSLVIKAHKDNNMYTKDENGNKFTVLNFNTSNVENYCLSYLIECEYTKEEYIEEGYKNSAFGKNVAINYYESENGKDLYVNKDTTNSQHSVEVNEKDIVLKKRDEYSILRTIVAEGAPITNLNKGIKKVYVNSDIDGNKIDITEEEIIQFVNMMNIDLYIRIVLYDPSSSYPNVLAGYYTDESYDVAYGYLEIGKRISEYNAYLKEYIYDEAKKNIEEAIVQTKKSYKKFDNDIVKNNSKVPTIAHCVGRCTYENGKYIIDFNSSGDLSGLFYINGAIENDTAQRLIKANKENNINIKSKIEAKIKEVKLTTDSAEYKIENKKIEEINNNEEILQYSNIEPTKNIILYFAVISLVIILIIILIVIKIRRKNNGRK